MGLFQIRTDLALEARENMDTAGGAVHGVRVEEENVLGGEVRITRVHIDTKNGAKAMGKPMGMYITMEAPLLAEADDRHHAELAKAIAREMLQVMPKRKEEMSVLVVGLGNREVTADSLGPHVTDHICVNRHMVLEYGRAACEDGRMHVISALTPGVMARTGMESAEIIKGVVSQIHPDYMIAVDALAARSLKRLNRTIQITNTGIQPGSGVGNHRYALNQESVGIPVIAIGVPTVVDAGTIVGDALAKLLREAKESATVLTKTVSPGGLAELGTMYVTSKDVDSHIEQIAHVLCDAINLAL